MDENMGRDMQKLTELFLHVRVYLRTKHRMMMRWQLVRHLERHFASQGDVKSGFLSVPGGLVSEMKHPTYRYILWAVIRRGSGCRFFPCIRKQKMSSVNVLSVNFLIFN